MKKRFIATILIAGVFSAALVGCGDSASRDADGKKSDTDTLTISKGGITLEEYSDDPGVSADEVESFVKGELSPVAGAQFEECSAEEGRIYLKTAYDGPVSYTNYTGYRLYYGEVLDGRLSGLSFGDTIYEVAGNAVGEGSYEVSDSDSFAAVSQSITVKVPGEIIGISDPDAVVKKDRALVHAEGEEDLVYIIYK